MKEIHEWKVGLTRMSRFPAYLLAAMLCLACTPDSPQEPAAMPEATVPPDSSAVSETNQPQAAPATTGELADTSWQLVKIMSMDDSFEEPDDASLYTLKFNADGTAQMRIDCNRGTGSWTSESPGQLQFGPIAATRALCPPGSLHDVYLAQFEWVRSYVLKNGHLFLATMADGSIIEFEPVTEPLAATVYGEEIRTANAEEMQQALLTRVFDRYAAEHSVVATDAEINAFIERMKEDMGDDYEGTEGLSSEEVAEINAMRQDMARSIIRRWKLNRELYNQYGGRIIYQQLGPEPLDAYREYLEERQAAGDFVIENEAFEETFWRYFRDDSMHDFYETGSAEEAAAFQTRPW